MTEQFTTRLDPTGIPGLDTILNGGLPAGRVHLVQGGPGSGKTTLGLQFALEGCRRGQTSLYVTMAETEREIHAIAGSHGWNLDQLSLLYQGPIETEDYESQTVLHPAEVELPDTLNGLLERVEEVRPRRLVLDSLSELRILARDPGWFRRELLRLRDRVQALECSVLFLDSGDATATAESLLSGVICLDRLSRSYGPDRRRLRVVKMRGHEFSSGSHDFRLRRGGIDVFPRLVAAEHREQFAPATLSTGIEDLDSMLGGGLDMGTATLLFGSTGTGKSTLGFQCAAAAAERGDRVLAYVFDERLQTVYQRAEGMGIDLETRVREGRIILRQVDTAEFTPGEFSDDVRRHVQGNDVKFVLIDSVNAYLNAMPGEDLLDVYLHELLAYLSQRAVTSVLIGAEHSLSGQVPPSRIDVTYLADTVVLLRTLEFRGRFRKTLSVYKRRAGPHESLVRELNFLPGAIQLGDVVSLGNRETPAPQNVVPPPERPRG